MNKRLFSVVGIIKKNSLGRNIDCDRDFLFDYFSRNIFVPFMYPYVVSRLAFLRTKIYFPSQSSLFLCCEPYFTHTGNSGITGGYFDRRP
jgi:hypothetical protein